MQVVAHSRLGRSDGARVQSADVADVVDLVAFPVPVLRRTIPVIAHYNTQSERTGKHLLILLASQQS